MSLLISCQQPTDIRNYKIFKYNQDTDITSIDPAFARNQGNRMVVTQLYNGLVELDENLNVVSSIATRWNISPDGKTYTFYLRTDVKFHNNEVFPSGIGRKVKAQDFVYSFQRIINKKTASPGAWIFNDKVLRTRNGIFSDSCFKAVNDTTFKIYLNQSFPPFLQILTMPYASVVPIEIVDKWGKDFRNHPVGTGPFKLKYWEDKSVLLLSKNETYWKKDSLGYPLPYLDGVHISFINDRNLAFMTFMQKKIDFISGLDENSRDIVFNPNGTIQKTFADNYTVSKTPYMNTEYIGFLLDSSTYENKHHPLLDKKVRQALNYGIDKGGMIQYILNNVGDEGRAGFIPYSLIAKDINTVKGYSFNPEKAQSLLNQAGYPKGKGMPILKLTTIVRFPYKEIAEYIQREWAKLGVRLQVETLDYPTLLETVARGEVTIFRASWEGDYPDPENYLALFYSKNFTPSGPNKTRYKNAAFDSLYNKALIVNNISKRTNLYQQMDQLAMNDAPMVILFYDQVVRLSQKHITGLRTNAANNLILEKVDIKK